MLVAHFAHRSGQMAYREIAEALGMNHYSAVASSIRRLKILCYENEHIRRLEKRIRQNITLNQTPFDPPWNDCGFANRKGRSTDCP